MSDTDQQPDDLRSLLSASFDQTMAPKEDPAPKVETVETKPEPPEPPAEKPKAEGDRARGPDGKFVKTDTEKKTEPVKEEPEPKTEDKPEDKAEPKAEDKPAETKGGALAPPASMTASEKTMFKALSPEMQEWVARRERERDTGFQNKIKEFAEFKREYEPVDEMFRPHRERMKQLGQTPSGLIKAWGQVELDLANGQAPRILDGIIAGYNVNFDAYARSKGYVRDATPGAHPDPSVPTNGSHQAQPQYDPRLVQELQALKARIDAREQNDRNQLTQAARNREAAVEADIQNFKSATNDKGELLHPYFDEVESVMITLAQAAQLGKQPIPKLQELYETAVQVNPSTRAAIDTARRQAEEAKRTEEARAKAASARKAASSVTGAPGSGQATRPVRGEMSLREQLEEAFSDRAAS